MQTKGGAAIAYFIHLFTFKAEALQGGVEKEEKNNNKILQQRTVAIFIIYGCLEGGDVSDRSNRNGRVVPFSTRYRDKRISI